MSITENLGTDFLVTVDLGDVTIKATIQEGDEPQPGDTVSLAPSTRRVLLYDRESGDAAVTTRLTRAGTRATTAPRASTSTSSSRSRRAPPPSTVTLDYDRTETILDLGLIGPDRFCGWSGSERANVVVTQRVGDAGLPARARSPARGRSSSACTGSLRVASTCTVDVARRPTAPAPPAPPPRPPRPQRPPRRDLPAAAGHEWLAGDFHSHTVHSDGSLEIVELAALAAGAWSRPARRHRPQHGQPPRRTCAAAGDHAGILLVPGQEVTTDVGHANCFGAIGWIDFRDPPDRWHARPTERGGLMSVNHPWAWDCAWRMPLTQPADLVEMWHWTWDRREPTPLADWPTFGRCRSAAATSTGRATPRSPRRPPGWRPRSARRRRAAAMVDGRVAISADPASPVLLRDGDELVPIDADGTTLVDDHRGARLVVDGTIVVFTR